MTKPDKVALIRADASAEIGAGHVMRCIALAQAWQQTGGRAIFAVASGEELEGRILAECAGFERIAATPGSREDALQTAALRDRTRAEWLVVDGYHFSAEYRTSMRSAASHLLLMDDGEEHFPCECDVILNPDPDATEELYPEPGREAQVLRGPRYALLRSEFLEYHRERRDVPPVAARVLVTFGGGDAHNVTLQVVEALHRLSDLDLEVTVVAGASNPHRASLQAAMARAPQAKLSWNVESMPGLMAQSDLAITAGGGTCYELAFMRVPMFLVSIAKNHERAVQAYAAAGAAIDGGWFSKLGRDVLSSKLRQAICDRELRQRLVENAGRLVDGKGAQRVVETMLAICQRERKVTA